MSSTAPLHTDPELSFQCTRCGRCCHRPEGVAISGAERRALEALDWGGQRPARLSERAGGGWVLARDSGGRCVFLEGDGRCAVYRRWGEAQLPGVCRRFPFLTTPAMSGVWVSASFGCTAVQEGRGEALAQREDRLRALFEAELGEVDAGAAERWPVREGISADEGQTRRALRRLLRGLGGRLFPALRRLAAAAERWPEPIRGAPERSPRPARPLDVYGPARHAFAQLLLPDALDPSTLLGRVQSVLTLPRMAGFVHVYKSRYLGRVIAQGQVWRHPGALPPESEALLLRFLRSRLHSRMIFRQSPGAAAGLTRLIFQVDAALYFARALAAEDPLSHRDVLQGLSVAELGLHYPGDERAWSPRAPRLSDDPKLALAAATLFQPAEP